MSKLQDVAVLGAGPAGMAAAVRLRALGVPVALIDEQPAPGGQIWRNVEGNENTAVGKALGSDYAAGAAAAAALNESGCVLRFGNQLWQLEDAQPEAKWRVFVKAGGGLDMLPASAVLLAGGAQERPNPFPGWTLPGVVSVGAAQILMKTAGQIPEEPVWIAGSGPLPLLYMTQLLALGGKIAGYLDTSPRGNLAAALPHLPRALAAWKDLRKGLGWLQTLRRSGVPVVKDVAEIAAAGNDRLESLTYRPRGSKAVTVPARLLLVHEGVVPGIHVTMAMGCAHDWRDDQVCFAPRLDGWGETSRAGLYVAGDGAGIGGAEAARLRGEIAALGIACKLGKLSEAEARQLAAPLRRALDRALAPRRFLDALYRPRPEVFAPAEETVVCRCEEVTAGQIRRAAGKGGPNQLKAFTRAGMGPCQGRQCGYTVSHLLAHSLNSSAAEVGFFHVRPPLKPVTLGELATLEIEEATP
ncbi:FAD-dependent oxidoreductase [Pelagibius sp. 7325]|uniref:FAD-dependent oxidoreductase n=1 Tax=Pelagibius sp. 7325 TaxID=3131994 RepID=UPI0030EE8CA3